MVNDALCKIRMFFGGNFAELVPEGERGWFIERVGGADAADGAASVGRIRRPAGIPIAGGRAAGGVLGARRIAMAT